MTLPLESERKWMGGWRNKQCDVATTLAAVRVSIFRGSWVTALIPALYYRRVLSPLFWRNGKYQNALKCHFWDANPREVCDRGCTSAVVWLVFSSIALLASEHRWRFICCLFPLDLFSFSIPIFLHPLPQELVCQQNPCTSLCTYQTVYPFPVGTVLHLWLSQPIATLRVHSKLWFRHSALPALLYQPLPPPSTLSGDFCFFHMHGVWSLPSAIP